MLTFYDCKTAPSPRRTRIFIAEKGLDIETVQIDLTKGEQMSPEFRAINPRCAVPALKVETGEVITENVAIAQYLEELQPEPPLMGRDALERARVLEWNWRCEFEGLSAVAEILRNTSPHMKGRAMTGPNDIEQLPELAERGRLRWGYFCEDLNSRLEQNDYIAGSVFSLADITAMVGIDFSKWVKASPGAGLTALWDWHKRVSARPSASA